LKEIVFVAAKFLVPLLLLFNIFGWAGLPQREANRSSLTARELANLRRVVWAAWLVGLVFAVIVLFALVRVSPQLIKDEGAVFWWPFGIGITVGFIRAFSPTFLRWANVVPQIRRRIMSGLVIVAVGVSVACAVLYYDGGNYLQSMIAVAYLSMFLGYAAAHVLDLFS
jgi:hypothetical protein